MKYLVLCSILLLTGCSGHSYTTPKAAQQAFDVCEVHGGLGVIKTNTSDWNYTTFALCNNGIAVTLTEDYTKRNTGGI